MFAGMRVHFSARKYYRWGQGLKVTSHCTLMADSKLKPKPNLKLNSWPPSDSYKINFSQSVPATNSSFNKLVACTGTIVNKARSKIKMICAVQRASLDMVLLFNSTCLSGQSYPAEKCMADCALLWTQDFILSITNMQTWDKWVTRKFAIFACESVYCGWFLFVFVFTGAHRG